MGRIPRKKSNSKIHPFFILILVTIFSILIILAFALFRYGVTRGTIIITTVLSVMIVTLLLILKSYLKDVPTASEIFDFIPCRFGLGKMEKKRFVKFCRRCNSAYISLGIIFGLVAISESLKIELMDKIYNFITPKIGIFALVGISVALILSIPIHATIHAKLKKESEILRIITGILFSVGVILLVSWLLKTFFA